MVVYVVVFEGVIRRVTSEASDCSVLDYNLAEPLTGTVSYVFLLTRITRIARSSHYPFDARHDIPYFSLLVLIYLLFGSDIRHPGPELKAT